MTAGRTSNDYGTRWITWEDQRTILTRLRRTLMSTSAANQSSRAFRNSGQPLSAGARRCQEREVFLGRKKAANRLHARHRLLVPSQLSARKPAGGTKKPSRVPTRSKLPPRRHGSTRCVSQWPGPTPCLPPPVIVLCPRGKSAQTGATSAPTVYRGRSRVRKI